MVEHLVANERVEGSNLFSRSNLIQSGCEAGLFCWFTQNLAFRMRYG